MAKARAIIKRRKSVQNIRKITRTMELIATARFKKALDRATEAEAYTRKIAEIVAERMGELEAFFRRCVIAGQHDGDISSELDPGDSARLLLTTVMGLRVLARGFPDRAVLEGAARQAISILGKPGRRERTPARK